MKATLLEVIKFNNTRDLPDVFWTLGEVPENRLPMTKYGNHRDSGYAVSKRLTPSKHIPYGLSLTADIECKRMN
ncbi:MAG: hypothetical protein BWY71_00712 [Planctomycetes bacterium ADurb.Bin412]|nr:MAG: hypothetical protein BWY71_00712 [Planctomycetes bacterium ADurb.Bin412]